MKKTIFLLTLLLTINLFANSKYDYIYELTSENKKIGQLKIKSEKITQDEYHFTSSLIIEYKYLFGKYSYSLQESVVLKNNFIKELKVIESDNKNSRMVTAQQENNFLLYSNGIKVDLSKIDYLPFDFKSINYKKRINNKNFELLTFNTLSGEIYAEKNTLLSGKENTIFQIKTIDHQDNTEIKTIKKDGTIIKFKNEFFEAKLIEER